MEKGIELFVPGRLCLLGEHSDWAGKYRNTNEIIEKGYAIVTGIEEGIHAFAYPDERLGEVVALAVVPKEDQEINLRALKTYCARNLADFQQPHKIFIVDKLPKNTMGKLQRMAILDYVRENGLDQ